MVDKLDPSLLSFLTGLEQQDTDDPNKNPLLNPARNEHRKLNEIVDAFGKKLSIMKDKQRRDYIEAYDTHMQDIQQELYKLRSDVQSFDDKHLKVLKIQQLKNDEISLRQEAMRLDKSTLEYRRKIRELTAKLHSIERERDWLLKRLRKEKKCLKSLNKTYSKSMDFDDGSDSSSLFTTDSSVSFLLADRKMLSPNANNTKDKKLQERSNNLTNKSPNNSADVGDNVTWGESISTVSTGDLTATTSKKKKALAHLVKQRMIAEGMRDILSTALYSSINGTLGKSTNVSSRSFDHVLADCTKSISNESSGIFTHGLVQELAQFPILYETLLGMIGTGIERNREVVELGAVCTRLSFDAYPDVDDSSMLDILSCPFF